MGARLAAAAMLAVLTAPAMAAELALPGNAQMTREVRQEAGDHALPVGPWTDGGMATRDVQGTLAQQAWRIDSAAGTTLQVTDMLEAQLEAAGYTPLYRCQAAACGGFDFRFALPVLPPPEMFVDLFDYRFTAAQKPSEEAYVTLLVSRSGADIYVQVTQIGPEGPEAPQVAPAAPKPGGAPLVQALTQRGHAVLRDLDFATAADRLGPGPYASLTALAAFLRADDTRRVALVGHTDTVGGLEVNLALSRRRAQAVMQRLIDAHDVPPAQLEADGIGYLSPAAPNTTEAGREANRRVEAVLLSGG